MGTGVTEEGAEEVRTLKNAYTVIHIDTGQDVKAWFPDFPGLTVSGDRLADTLFTRVAYLVFEDAGAIECIGLFHGSTL